MLFCLQMLMVGDNDNSGFNELETQLIWDSEAADANSESSDDLDMPPIPHAPIPQPVGAQPPKTIPLKLLFDYTTPSGPGLDFY